MFKIFKKIILIIMMSFFTTSISANYEKLAYDFNFNDLSGDILNLSEYKN